MNLLLGLISSNQRIKHAGIYRFSIEITQRMAERLTMSSRGDPVRSCWITVDVSRREKLVETILSALSFSIKSRGQTKNI